MVLNDDWVSTYFKLPVRLSILCVTTISFTQNGEGRVRIFFSPTIYCNQSEDIQQLCWRSLLMACRRYIQWYISYFSSVTIDWYLAPHRWGFSITHSDAPQSVGLLWTSGQLVAETSTWQHSTLTTDRYPYPRWDSNPRLQLASGRRPTP